MLDSPPDHFTSSTEAIFSTSMITFLSCGETICAPSSQYALYPLYSFGLCEAVQTTPPLHFKCLIAKLNSGVGRRLSNKKTFFEIVKGISKNGIKSIRIGIKPGDDDENFMWVKSEKGYRWGDHMYKDDMYRD